MSTLRYVMVALHFVVKTLGSSTVKYSCRYLPAAFATGFPRAIAGQRWGKASEGGGAKAVCLAPLALSGGLIVFY